MKNHNCLYSGICAFFFNQGVQAQTVANFYLAFEAELSILPVMNKIDLKVARPEAVLKQIKNVFDIDPEEVIKVDILKTSINITC